MPPNFCPNCGIKIKADDSECCPKCGIKIGSKSPHTSIPSPPSLPIDSSFHIPHSSGKSGVTEEKGHKRNWFNIAILLIGFVIVAAVFAYIVLGAGFFTPQTSQPTVITPIPTPVPTNINIQSTSTKTATPNYVKEVTPFVTVTPTPVYQAAKNTGLETTINIHYNDFFCLDIQKELGVDYLYPDQKYTIWATSPGSGTVNVNVLLLKVGDYEKIQNVRPIWDVIKKTWVYEGIAPLIQLNDISAPQEKTSTIKIQDKYFLCADDRKESGVNDAIFRVPVKITRL